LRNWQEEERARVAERRRGAEWVAGALDPLLAVMLREHVDDQDLSVRLQNLFYVKFFPHKLL
jgi:hypothetical protein